MRRFIMSLHIKLRQRTGLKLNGDNLDRNSREQNYEIGCGGMLTSQNAIQMSSCHFNDHQAVLFLHTWLHTPVVFNGVMFCKLKVRG